MTGTKEEKQSWPGQHTQTWRETSGWKERKCLCKPQRFRRGETCARSTITHAQSNTSTKMRCACLCVGTQTHTHTNSYIFIYPPWTCRHTLWFWGAKQKSTLCVSTSCQRGLVFKKPQREKKRSSIISQSWLIQRPGKKGNKKYWWEGDNGGEGTLSLVCGV